MCHNVENLQCAVLAPQSKWWRETDGTEENSDHAWIQLLQITWNEDSWIVGKNKFVRRENAAILKVLKNAPTWTWPDFLSLASCATILVSMRAKKFNPAHLSPMQRLADAGWTPQFVQNVQSFNVGCAVHSAFEWMCTKCRKWKCAEYKSANLGCSSKCKAVSDQAAQEISPHPTFSFSWSSSLWWRWSLFVTMLIAFLKSLSINRMSRRVCLINVRLNEEPVWESGTHKDPHKMYATGIWCSYNIHDTTEFSGHSPYPISVS